MTKYPYILFVLLLASFSSCQTVEQLSIDYMLPAEISFPNELKRVAVVNNVSDTPDNTLQPCSSLSRGTTRTHYRSIGQSYCRTELFQ